MESPPPPYTRSPQRSAFQPPAYTFSPPFYTLPPTRNVHRRFRQVSFGGFDLARIAARNSRILKAKGLPAPAISECLIATGAIENRWSLLHTSPGYEPFEQHLGLKVPDLRP